MPFVGLLPAIAAGIATTIFGVSSVRITADTAYSRRVGRLEDLLRGSTEMVKANAFLGDLLGEVRLSGDPRARDGMRIEI